MQAVIDDFCQYLQVRHSGNTVSAYRSDLTKFAAYLETTFGIRAWTDVKPRHIDLFITSLAGMKKSSLSRKLACISSFYRYLVRQGAVLENPARDIDPIKVPKRAPDFMEREQIKVARTVSEHETLLVAVIVEVLLSTGVRVSELCNANRSSVNSKDKTMTVIGKGDKQRIVYLSDRAAVFVDNYLKSRKDVDASLLFFNGRRMTRFQVYRVVRKIGERYLGRKLSPHLFRHTLATHSALSGMPLQELQGVLGHANVNTTMIYVHPSKAIREHFDHAIESMEPETEPVVDDAGKDV
jgi:site-specific recombinase XerD